MAPSATLNISARAKKMRAEGIDVIDLSVGEPDFPTPANIKDAAKRALDQDFTRYTPAAGIQPLRQAVADRIFRDHGVRYEIEQTIVSAGAKQCLYNACAVLLDPGDRVIVFAPYWVSYPEIVRLVGGDPVVVPTLESREFRFSAADVRPHIAGAKAIIINSPGNPTGVTLDRATLVEVAELAAEAGATIISDEIYGRLVYEGSEFVSVLDLPAELREQAIVVNGFSKTYAMTGWRIGYAVGPREIVAAMATLQGHSTSNVSSIAQMAGLEALTGPQDEVERMRLEFRRRRDFVLDRLRSVRGWSCPTPGGAFYAFVNVSASLGTRWERGAIPGTLALAEYLLERAQVAVVPGDAFGAPGYLRFSYAASMDRIRDGMDRIARAAGELRPA